MKSDVDTQKTPTNWLAYRHLTIAVPGLRKSYTPSYVPCQPPFVLYEHPPPRVPKVPEHQERSEQHMFGGHAAFPKKGPHLMLVESGFSFQFFPVP